MCFVCVSSISLQKSAGLHIRLCANRASVQAASTAPERLTIDPAFCVGHGGDLCTKHLAPLWRTASQSTYHEKIWKTYSKIWHNTTKSHLKPSICISLGVPTAAWWERAQVKRQNSAGVAPSPCLNGIYACHPSWDHSYEYIIICHTYRSCYMMWWCDVICHHGSVVWHSWVRHPTFSPVLLVVAHDARQVFLFSNHRQSSLWPNTKCCTNCRAL